MVSPSARRRAVKMSVQEGLGRVAAACRALELSRSSYYRSGRSSLESRRIHKEVLELSGKHPRYRYWRITALMRREGFEVNAKRVARIRREEGIKVNKKQRPMKRLGISTAASRAARASLELGLRERPDGKWKLFSHPHLAGRTHPAMPGDSSWVVDPSRRCHYGGRSGHRPLWSARKPAQRQRAEFIASCMQGWLKAQEIKTLYIKPGSPWENGHIESFHDKLRDECLNRELFGNLREARVILESWRLEYNERRPHSALGYRTPNEYAESRTNRLNGGCAPPNPAPLAAAGVRGELRINATRWQINENHATPCQQCQRQTFQVDLS